MPEPTQPTDQTSPSDAGHTTTEYKMALVAGITGSVLAGMVATFAGLNATMPDVGWVTSGVIILGALTTALAPLLKYIAGRSQVKVALANFESAKVLAAASPPKAPPSF